MAYKIQRKCGKRDHLCFQSRINDIYFCVENAEIYIGSIFPYFYLSPASDTDRSQFKKPSRISRSMYMLRNISPKHFHLFDTVKKRSVTF